MSREFFPEWKIRTLPWWDRVRLFFARRCVSFDPGFPGSRVDNVIVFKRLGKRIFIVGEHQIPMGMLERGDEADG